MTSENPYLAHCLETTRFYLFAPLPDPETGASAGACPTLARPETHGAQQRALSRARGRLLRMTARQPLERDPLHELQRVFDSLVSFIARNPDVPLRMLRWSAQSRYARVQRRVRKVIDQFTLRLSLIIRRAQDQALVRQDIEPRDAAVLFVGIAQSLVLRLIAGFLQRERLAVEAARLFELYLGGLRCERVGMPCVFKR